MSNHLSIMENKESSVVKIEPDLASASIKKEDSNDKSVKCYQTDQHTQHVVECYSVYLNIKEEASYQIDENISEHSEDPLAIIDCKTETIKEEVCKEETKEDCVDSMFEEEKECFQLDYRYSNNISKDSFQYTSIHNEKTEDSNSNNGMSVSGAHFMDISINNTSALEDNPQHFNDMELEDVQNTQTINNTFNCSFCCKSFPCEYNLKRHVNSVHQKIKYKCEECHRMFTEAGSLRKHVSSVHKGIRNYECNICNKKFAISENLKRHIDNVHKKIKRYECFECHRMFNQSANLNKHVSRVHQGIRNYECKECLKMFTEVASLQRHINSVHRGIKHKCSECDKAFTEVHTLKKHINTKHRGIRYGCNECSKSYTEIRRLRVHVKTKHKALP